MASFNVRSVLAMVLGTLLALRCADALDSACTAAELSEHDGIVAQEAKETEFNELDSVNEKIKLITLFKNAIYDNIGRLKTANGEYKLLENKIIKQNDQPIMVEMKGNVVFEFDFDESRGYSVIDMSSPVQAFSVDTKRSLPSTSLKGDRWISILTSEHWVHFAELLAVGQVKDFPLVDGLDPVRGGRIAYRDDKSMAYKHTRSGITFDPREMFGQVGLSFDKLFQQYVDELKQTGGRKGEIRLAKAKSRNSYRLSYLFPMPAEGPKSQLKVVYLIDGSQDFNVTLWEIYIGNRLSEERDISYAKYADVWFPKMFAYSIYINLFKEPSIARTLVLEKIKINEIIPDSNFGLSRLNFKYGDRFQDNITRTMKVYDGSKLVAAEDFKDVPRSTPATSSGAGGRFWFLLANIMVLIIITFVMVRRQKNSRGEAKNGSH